MSWTTSEFFFYIQIITSITKKTATLTLRQVEIIDCGTYTCKLSNTVSNVSVDFKLTVRGNILSDYYILMLIAQ